MHRHEAVDRRVDAIGRLLYLALARQHTSVPADFHEAACRNLRPMQPERDLVVAVALAGNRQSQVIENAFAETMPDGKPVRGGEIDSRLPLGGGDCRAV